MVAAYRALLQENRHEPGVGRIAPPRCHAPPAPPPRGTLRPRGARAGSCSSGRRSMCAAASPPSNNSSATTCRPTSSIRHVATMDRGLEACERRQCLRAPCARCAARSSASTRHRSHPLRVARQHAAQVDSRRHGGTCRTAAGAARAWRATSTSFIAACRRSCDALVTASCSARTC